MIGIILLVVILHVTEPVIYDRKLSDDATEDRNDTKGIHEHTHTHTHTYINATAYVTRLTRSDPTENRICVHCQSATIDERFASLDTSVE